MAALSVVNDGLSEVHQIDILTQALHLASICSGQE